MAISVSSIFAAQEAPDLSEEKLLEMAQEEEQKKIKKHFSNISQDHRTGFVFFIEIFHKLLNGLKEDDFLSAEIENVKQWAIINDKTKYKSLIDALDGMVIYKKLKAWYEEQKQTQEQQSNLIEIGKNLDQIMMLKQKQGPLLTLYKSLLEIRGKLYDLRDGAFCEDLSQKIQNSLKFIKDIKDHDFNGYKTVLEKMSAAKSDHSKHYEELDKVGNGNCIETSFLAIIESYNRKIRDIETSLPKILPENLDKKEEFLRLLTLFCSVNHDDKQKDLESHQRARALIKQLNSIIKKDQDPSLKKSAENLTEIATASIDDEPNKIIKVVIKAVEEDFNKLKKYLEPLIADFEESKSKHEQSKDKEKCEAYSYFIKELKSKHLFALKNFDEYYKNIKSKNPLASQTFGTLLSWAGKAYGIFFELFKNDCDDKTINTKGVNSTMWNGILWAFHAANLVAGYSREVYLLSEKKLKPVIMGSPENRDFEFFLEAFGKKSFSLNFILGVDFEESGFGIKASALAGTVKKLVMPEIGKIGFVRSLGGMNMMGIDDDHSFVGQLQQRGIKMIISALYYHTMRKQYFECAGLTGWVPWKHLVKDIVSMTGATAGGELKKLIQKSFSLGAIENIGQWTFGVVTPDLIDKAVNVGIDLSLTSPRLKPWLAKIADFEDKDIFTGTWYNAIQMKHPQLTFQNMRSMYLDQEVLAFIVSRVTGSLAGHVGAAGSGAIISMIQKIVGSISGNTEIANMSQEEIRMKVLLAFLRTLGIHDEQLLSLLSKEVLINLTEHKPFGVTFFKCSDMNEALKVLDNKEQLNDEKLVNKVLEKLSNCLVPNIFGSLVEKLGGIAADHYTRKWWIQHVEKNGTTVLLPIGLFSA